MNRFASVRYDGVLDEQERNEASRSLRSAGVRATSWTTGAGRTYASVTFSDEPALRAAAGAMARVDVPPLAVLRIAPDAPRRLAALSDALGGPGRPVGVCELRAEAAALVVEIDASRTPLALVLAVIDAELQSAPGRTIEPLVILDDAALAAFAGDLLGEPSLDASRLIETYLEPLLASGAEAAS